MTATPSSSTTAVCAQSGDDAFRTDHSVGSCRADIQSWPKLHQEQTDQCSGDTAVEADVSMRGNHVCNDRLDDTTPIVLPVPMVDLEAAATRLRPDPALHKALKRLLEGGWSYQNDQSLVITFEPRSKGRKGKQAKPYTTTGDHCTCPGAIIRGGCYHPLAWQIVNETLVPTTAIQCMLPSAIFLRLCWFALSTDMDHIILRADSGSDTLTLAVPQMVTGSIIVDTATPVILVIEQQVRAMDLKRVVDALADALPPQGELLLLEVDIGTLMIVAGTEDTPTFVDGLILLPMDAPTPPLA